MLDGAIFELSCRLRCSRVFYVFDSRFWFIRIHGKDRKRNRVTFEYVLLHGINDSIKEAKQLVTLLSPLRCKLNIIACNQNNLGFTPPPSQQLNKFIAVMLDAPFTVTLRKNRGEDIAAACGQLVVKLKEKSIFI